ncbi:MAG: adenylate/guanylate cyclase domain-containing protein [Rhodoferax sp.]|nr:adenylate/guanylate cyclase domain-containing protein [Rhodoferax sp.]MCF8208823.1 adenylate/guanylate cyclase domain-containing protein [Rhodoferax sp.]
MTDFTSDEKPKGKGAIQWTYLLTSAIIILTLMAVVGYLNVKNLQENYKKSFFESSLAVSKSGIKTIEHGLIYGKQLPSFYSASAIVNEIHEYISSADNVSIVSPDGNVYFSVFPKKVPTPETYQALLARLDSALILQSGAQTLLSDGIYHEFMPVMGKDGTISAYLDVSFDESVLSSKTIGFTQSSGLTILVVTLLGTVLFMSILSRVRATNERGEVRRMMLMSIMIANISFCQLVFTGINLMNYRDVLQSNASENTRFVAEIIRRNIDSVIAKGLTFVELEQVQKWMASVVSSTADIKGAVVAVNDGSVSYSSSPGLDVKTRSGQAAPIALALKPDRVNNQATLTMVLDSENLQRKLLAIAGLSGIIMAGSIAALIQITFVVLFVLNRRAISSLKDHNDELENIVALRTREIQLEKEKSDELLLNILPQKVADDLKESGHSDPQMFPNVSVFFSDVVGFTNLSKDLEPKLLIEELSDIFTNFDLIIERYDCQRIKTIGDAYLCVSGMPVADTRHAHNLLNAALEIIDYLKQRNLSSEIQWQIRVGINSGPVVGGIVGIRKYLYDVFGDTINTASRMESNSEPMRINISENTWNLVKNDFKIAARGQFEVKGKGAMHMYFVEDRL